MRCSWQASGRSRLILVTPYDSVQEVAARTFWFISLNWLLRDKFESWRVVGKISAPTLLIAAEHDEVIPGANTEALFKHFRPGIARLQQIKGTGHNSVSQSDDYLPLLKSIW